MSGAFKSFLLGAAVGLAGTLTYLTPAIAKEIPDLHAIFHRLQGQVIGPAGKRSQTASDRPRDRRGIHRLPRLDAPFNRYRRV
jgi:hypothetical protein